MRKPMGTVRPAVAHQAEEHLDEKAQGRGPPSPGGGRPAGEARLKGQGVFVRERDQI